MGHQASGRAEVYRAGEADRRGRSARRLLHQGEAEALRPRQSGRGQGEGRRRDPRRREREGASRRHVQGAEERHRARRRRQDRAPHRWPRSEDRAPHRLRGARAAAHARLGAVHARRDAGDRRRHARHRRGRAVRRRARGHPQRALHAPLQLPALLGGRDGPHGLARPPRDRPRQARLARPASRDAGAGRVPLHHPPRLGDHRVRTAPRRWPPCAAARWR